MIFKHGYGLCNGERYIIFTNLSNTEMILVTNYKLGIKGEPIENVMPHKRIVFDKASMELTINENLFVHVFIEVPYMRNTPSNKSWFSRNIYHLR